MCTQSLSLRAFRIAYDGRPYHGFQRQPDVSTVENTLFDALDELAVLSIPEQAGDTSSSPSSSSSPSPSAAEDTPSGNASTGNASTEGESTGNAPAGSAPTGYTAAGRTDAGVSALAQTVAFEAPDWLTPAAFNSALPAAIRVWADADVSSDFHATHDATSRTYRYHLHAPESMVCDERARRALDGLCGKHDFHNLTPDETGTVRTLDGEIHRDGEFLLVQLRAGGFARQLVRRIVTLVDEIARGERERSAIDRVLDPDPLPGPDGVGPAPAQPLVLADVTYPDVDFVEDERASASAHTVFENKRVEHAAWARVATDIRNRLK